MDLLQFFVNALIRFARWIFARLLAKKMCKLLSFSHWTQQLGANWKMCDGEAFNRQSPWANYRGIRLLRNVINNYSSTWHFCDVRFRGVELKVPVRTAQIAWKLSLFRACADTFTTRSLIHVKHILRSMACSSKIQPKIYLIVTWHFHCMMYYITVFAVCHVYQLQTDAMEKKVFFPSSLRQNEN